MTIQFRVLGHRSPRHMGTVARPDRARNIGRNAPYDRDCGPIANSDGVLERRRV